MGSLSKLEVGDILTCEVCDHPILKCERVPKYLEVQYHLCFSGVKENDYNSFYGVKGYCPKEDCTGRWFGDEKVFSIHVRGKGWLKK